MADVTKTYEEFLLDVSPEVYPYVEQLNALFLQGGCTVSVAQAKSGCVVSYTYTPQKRVIANFVFRKKGLLIRIYGDRVNAYEDFLQTLPPAMHQAVEKAPVCRRMIDPTKCSSRCPMGNQFTLDGTLHKKCRYSNFMFLLDAESFPFIRTFVENELRARAA